MSALAARLRFDTVFIFLLNCQVCRYKLFDGAELVVDESWIGGQNLAPLSRISLSSVAVPPIVCVLIVCKLSKSF